MANIKSARKAARQAVKRRAQNASQRTQLSTAVKNVEKAIAAGDKAKAAVALERSRSVIDRMEPPRAGNQGDAVAASAGVTRSPQPGELGALRHAPLAGAQLVVLRKFARNR